MGRLSHRHVPLRQPRPEVGSRSPFPPRKVENWSRLKSGGIFDTKMSEHRLPSPFVSGQRVGFSVVRYAPTVVGKSVDSVVPATYTFPSASTATPPGWSIKEPPSRVEANNLEPSGLSFATKTSVDSFFCSLKRTLTGWEVRIESRCTRNHCAVVPGHGKPVELVLRSGAADPC